ncbi:MAG TPA: hypothetical protein VIA06_05390 [Candidatus Dormibacteraeota bacterium]|nr:hypothetical protein [Candidatus Dormibacteraeota bacterium]
MPDPVHPTPPEGPAAETEPVAESGREHVRDEVEEVLGLGTAFRDKVIRLGTMDRGLAMLTLGAMVVVVLCALLLVLSGLPGAAGPMSLPMVIASGTFLAVAWSYLLGGALHAHALVRFLLLALFTFTVAVSMQTLWSIDSGLVQAGFTEGLWAQAIPAMCLFGGAIILLAVVWAMAIAMWLVDRAHDRSRPHLHHRHRLKVPTYLFYLAVIIVEYLVLLGGGIQMHGLNFQLVVDSQLFWLEWLLIPVLYLAGTDFTEWSQVVGARISAAVHTGTGRFGPWLMALAVAGVGAAVVVQTVQANTLHWALTEAVPSIVVLALMGVCAHLAIRRRPEAEVPFWSLVIAALFGYGILTGGTVIGVHLVRGDIPSSELLAEADFTLVFVWIPVVAFCVWLARRGGQFATGALFVALCALFDFGEGAHYLGGLVLGHPLPDWVIPITMTSLRMTVAAAAVVYALFLVVTGRVVRHQVPLRLVLTLLIGLLGIWFLHDGVFQTALNASDEFTSVQAAVLLIALLWDVAMSGEAVTNIHGRHMPRHSRVLIYFGYTMLVATAVLFSATSQQEFGRGLGLVFDSDSWPQFGILRMGSALLLTFFVAGLAGWLRRRGDKAAAEKDGEENRIDRTELIEG